MASLGVNKRRQDNSYPAPTLYEGREGSDAHALWRPRHHLEETTPTGHILWRYTADSHHFNA